ncbi:MAG TPA: outer membrane beta-barrel protein [bacterium]|nr:outer membrane beta-barrel protein [bacterium]
MRKLFLLFPFILALAGPVRPADPMPENQRWIEAIDGGFIFPVSSAAGRDYDRGVGGDILIGYRFDRSFSLSADLGYYDCDQKGTGASAGEWIYVPMLAVARWTFGDGWVRPYALAGAGVAVNNYNLTQGVWGHVSNRETNLLLAPGAGALFIIAPGTALYLQARLDLNFTTPGGPWTDNPSLFMPVKGGLSLFVL